MTPALASALMPLMRLFDAETAHGLALKALGLGLAGGSAPDRHAALATTVMGMRFANPIGLAAGFDKAATAVVPLLKLGFGFVEAGTVAPQPQPGNPRPRMFRLEEDAAVINRMGFNTQGLAPYLANVKALPRPLPGIFGANIGVNKEGGDPVRDYPALYAQLAPFADYVTINISSPNTPGLRDLQGEEALARILDAMPARTVPFLVKLAPDLADEALPGILDVCIARGVAGIIISNTTIARPATLRSAQAKEAGGLSGQPLFERSTEVLRAAYRHAAGRLIFIGVGGIATPEQAYAKIRAGASLVQLYTGFAYGGPALVPTLLDGLARLLARDGLTSIEQAVGADS
ncbi:quinone-dependent dihydroorotate dehydrogenase [Rhodovarius crocodyli]|uniref:Dihydroorotate dehydrogenase (quinone) n=1 Tax=Rhodovarius crocodyli TaxID=1979269 RepID=A0A437MIN9_9PROT|nr:quinone-dependent dihydroorotate dehydrogenase [Rhodovarius crocodyli]RVT97524.1 quinone-dependent dihydroorotate dehydrogenase [Rhodovarius crocodyli]